MTSPQTEEFYAQYLPQNRIKEKIEQALRSKQDSIVTLNCEPIEFCGYNEINRLSVFPSETKPQIKYLDLFKNSSPLYDSVAVFNDIYIIDDSMLVRNGLPLREDNFIPGYLHSIYENHPKYVKTISSTYTKEFTWIKGPIFAPFHPWCKIYGHFLLEALPKLGIIKYFYDIGLKYPIYLNRSAPKFIFDYLKLSIPGANIIEADAEKIYNAEKIIVPNFDRDLGRLTSRRVRFLDGLVNKCVAKEKIDPGKKIFIWRDQTKNSFRYLKNQAALRDIAVSYGYEVVSPEILSVEAQIELFSDSISVVGEYSSALHNAIFCPTGSSVISFNWINFYQLSISLAKRQNLIVLTPESGSFVQADTVAPIEYTISEGLFQTMLDSSVLK